MRRDPRYRRARVAIATIAACLAGAALAPTAGARVVAGAEGATVGLQPLAMGLEEFKAAETAFKEGKAFANAEGHAVLPSTNVYAIYWDPQDLYHGDWQTLINNFLHNMGAASGATASVFAVDSQYTDAAGQHAAYAADFKGAYTDTQPYPSPAGCTDPHPIFQAPDTVTCLSGAQVEAALQTFISTHDLPTGMGTVYYVLTPPGVNECLGEGGEGYCAGSEGPAQTFCSYHSYINAESPNGGPNTILYAVIPWIAGGLGDYHLTAPDSEITAYRCQAGGEEPVAETPPEKEEKPPTQQEPNQTAGLGPDGSYDTGLADLIVSQIGVEQQDIVTDPLLNAWQQEGSGAEVTDVCRDYFAPSAGGSSGAQEHTGAGTLSNQSLAGGSYYINDSFSLANGQLPYPAITPCYNGVVLKPEFATPNTVNAGELVGFDGMESDVTLNWGTAYEGTKAKPTYAVYEWSFGDGDTVTGYAPGAPPVDSPEASPCEAPWVAPCAASTFHSYQYGGIYNVTLKITDTGGNTASISHTISVVGPPRPTPPGGEKTTTTEQTSTSSTSSQTGGAGSNKTTTTTTKTTSSTQSGGSHHHSTPRILPAPVVRAIALTGSLPEALKSGLPVHYAVNEQVAGYFEVLISSKLARRLHIKGRHATWLPKGAPGERVIAGRLLVTTRKAHGSVLIVLPPQVARKLAHLRKVTLTLRVIVRNAAQHPKVARQQTAVLLRGAGPAHHHRGSHHRRHHHHHRHHG